MDWRISLGQVRLPCYHHCILTYLAWRYNYNCAHIFRFLSAPSFLIPPNIKCFQNLDQLEELRVDFSHSGLVLQRACITQLFTSLATTHNAVLNLTMLKLTQLPRIDVQLLSFVAKGLPNLVYLHCTSIEGLDMDCCPNCYEDSLTRINHSPIPDMFPDAIHLAVSFFSSEMANVFYLFLSPEACIRKCFGASQKPRSCLLRRLAVALSHARIAYPPWCSHRRRCPP
jgi:hypothetical protein